ncbi:MAG: hypothetical protein EPN49_10770, partial [Rhodanobacter sp.]
MSGSPLSPAHHGTNQHADAARIRNLVWADFKHCAAQRRLQTALQHSSPRRVRHLARYVTAALRHKSNSARRRARHAAPRRELTGHRYLARVLPVQGGAMRGAGAQPSHGSFGAHADTQFQATKRDAPIESAVPCAIHGEKIMNKDTQRKGTRQRAGIVQAGLSAGIVLLGLAACPLPAGAT